MLEALQWQAKHSDEDIISKREDMMTALEFASAEQRSTGLVQTWFGDCAEHVRKVAGDAQPLLMEQLATVTDHRDKECVQFMRVGAPFTYQLPSSGLGEVLPDPAGMPSGILGGHCREHNQALLGSLHEDSHAEALLKAACEDAKLGRMSMPTRIIGNELILDDVLLHPRFAAVQEKPDGSSKVRPIDNFSWSALKPSGVGQMARKRKIKAESLNGHCVPRESIHHDHLDVLMQAMTVGKELSGRTYGMFKADIDSAYRRIPIMAHHLWACWIAFMCGGDVWVAQHMAMPFGALAAVHAWERIGALLCHIACRLLRMAVFRYVDDYFGCERPAVLEHGLGCLVRLIRLLLGASAVADSKVGFGKKIVLLGVQVEAGKHGYKCKPSADKVAKWLVCIGVALDTNCLSPGQASKLAGRLSWSCQHLFHKLGRAMLGPLFRQKFAARPWKLSEDLRNALCWWQRILKLGIAEKSAWQSPKSDIVHIFCDAAGEPARVAAIVWYKGETLYTDCEPPSVITNRWCARQDQQIMGLELLSIALALSTFEHLCRGRRVIIFRDNRGAECCFRNGAAKHRDHSHIVNAMWTHAALCHMHLRIERVGTHDNWSDLPSRHEYDTLVRVGAVKCEPKFGEVYDLEDTSRVLSKYLR